MTEITKISSLGKPAPITKTSSSNKKIVEKESNINLAKANIDHNRKPQETAKRSAEYLNKIPANPALKIEERKATLIGFAQLIKQSSQEFMDGGAIPLSTSKIDNLYQSLAKLLIKYANLSSEELKSSVIQDDLNYISGLNSKTYLFGKPSSDNVQLPQQVENLLNSLQDITSINDPIMIRK